MKFKKKFKNIIDSENIFDFVYMYWKKENTS